MSHALAPWKSIWHTAHSTCTQDEHQYISSQCRSVLHKLHFKNRNGEKEKHLDLTSCVWFCRKGTPRYQPPLLILMTNVMQSLWEQGRTIFKSAETEKRSCSSQNPVCWKWLGAMKFWKPSIEAGCLLASARAWARYRSPSRQPASILGFQNFIGSRHFQQTGSDWSLIAFRFKTVLYLT